MLLFDGPRQHDDLACAARRQRKPSLRRAHVGQRPKHRAKPPDFDSQPRAMRFIGDASLRMRARRACPSARLRATLRPARVRARTAPDAWRARPPCVRHARHDGTRPRRVPSTPATLRPPRAGGVAPRHCAIRRAAGVFRTRDALSTSAVSAGIPAWRAARSARASARACRLRPQAPHRDPRDHQLVGGPRRAAGRARVELGERTLGLVEAPDQQEAPDLEITRMRGVHPVAVLFERRPRRVERLRGPAQVARDERDLGLGDDAPARGPRPLSDRRRAPPVAGEPSLERDRRAAPSRCREARAQARRRAGRPASVRRGDHPPRVHAPRP